MQITKRKLTPQLADAVTHWEAKGKDLLKVYKKSTCKSVEAVIRKIEASGFEGVVEVRGLTMHATTKPLLITNLKSQSN